MLDNPLPDQVMAEKDQIHLDRNFEDLCKIHGVEIAKHYKVHPDLHDEFAEWYHDYMSQNTHLFEHDCITLDDSYIREWWTDNSYLYDALDILDSIINYEPSDAELEAYNDYQDPPHVVNQRMLEMKSESHGRRFI